MGAGFEGDRSIPESQAEAFGCTAFSVSDQN